MKLTPFQIVYISEPDQDSDVTLEPMMLLSETRDHLEKTDFSKHFAFESLQLYQTIRSEGELMFSNGTHVAFGGQATFSENTMTNEEMLEVQYLSFLGQNETAYVNRLRLMGWTGLQRALLMTATGGMINFDNGAMKMMPVASEDDSRDMEPGMSNMIVSIATMIPIAILSLAIFIFTGYALRTKIHWKLAASDTDSVWKLGRQRKAPGSMTNNDNSTASSASVRVAIGSGARQGPTIHPTLLRIQERAARAADKV